VIEGIVIKATGSSYSVQTGDGKAYVCSVKGKLRLSTSKSTNPIAIGDFVNFEIDEADSTGVIVDIKDRKNYIIRKSTNLSRQTHVIAANVDQALLVVTLKDPETTLEFVDRYLVSLEAYKIPVVIVFNKTDLFDDYLNTYCNALIDIYEKIGYKCLKTSTVNNENIDTLTGLLKNKTSVISGNSGVGKSTLVNCIDPALELKTGNISESLKSGKHTTSNYEMFPLHFGGYIIDTPGIRGFGLTNIEKEELYHFFPEIFKHAKHCKFHNCIHVNEPGCNVKKAVNDGLISESRYVSYLNIYFDDNSKYR
jgi:ribosome biogenesis GTPase